MKNIIKIVSIALLAGCLTACGDATATVSDSNDLLFSIDGNKYTKGDLYSQMIDDDEGNTIVSMALHLIADAEVETTDEITEAAEEVYDDYEDTFSSYFDSMEEAIEYYGYESSDDFMEFCISTAKANYLITQYIEDNWETIVETYFPVKARIIYVDSSDVGSTTALASAEAALAALQDGESFVTVAETYSSDTDLAEETVYLANDSDLDYNVLAYMLDATTTGLSDVITANDEDGFYIVYITNINASQMKDDIIDLLNDSDDFADEVYRYYYQLHEFTIYDIDVYNYVVENYEDYYVQTTGPSGSLTEESDDDE